MFYNHRFCSSLRVFFIISIIYIFLSLIIFLKALKSSNYDADPLVGSSGISIGTQFTQVEGRVLSSPRVSILQNLKG